MIRIRSRWILLLVCSFSLVAQAQPSSLETKLREQLRESRSQLQDLQSQQAQWQNEKTALEHERDEAVAKAGKSSVAPTPAATRSKASEDRQVQVALRDSERARQEAEARYRSADASHARDSEQMKTERDRAVAELARAHDQIQVCSARNIRLYEVGQSVVDAYAHLGVGDLVAARQPFAAKARVRLDEAAQAYGDKLYEQRFDPRGAVAPAAAPGQ